MKKQNYLLKYNRQITFLLVAFLIIFSFYSFYTSEHVQSQMINELGNQIAVLYGSTDERDFAQYKRVILDHTDDMEAFLQKEPSDEEYQQWLYNMTNLMQEITGNSHIDVGLISDGVLHAYDGATGNATGSDFYQKAIANGKTPVFSDIFQNKESSGKNVRIMYVNPDTNNGIVLKLFQESFQEMHESEIMEKQGTYFLCDSQGNMLYYLSSCQREHPNANDFTVELCQQIDAANITDGNNYLTAKDMEQKNCRVYSYQLSDGWRGIVLIPNDTFHKSSRQLTKETYIQYLGKEISQSEILDMVVNAYVSEGHKKTEIKEIELYIKPEDNAAYYVINGTATGKVYLKKLSKKII